ncbi:MAG: hypothetical protein EHM93_04005 [Bacteroidales bacterium]|nr:MAG: hypothetical protein EHM93_04005 [Bacteroidales bacterium]
MKHSTVERFMVNFNFKAMRKITKALLILMVFIPIAFSSCEKFTGDTDSISGAWRCVEESGAINPRQYSVTIYRAGAGFDSTYFVINNFHNIGNEVDTYVQLIDTVITIRDINGYNAAGEGHVSRDFKSIDWNYSISGEYVRALYFKR